MKKTISLALGLAMTLTAVQPSLSHANALRSPANAYETLARWGLDADIRLLKTEFFGDKLGLEGGYVYEIDPSYNEGLYTRTDRYYFNTDLDSDPGKLELTDAKGSEFSVGLGVKHDLELEFARQFESAERAAKAKPYFYKNVPLSADDAIQNLNEGDYVSLKTQLSLLVGGEFLQGLGSTTVGLTVGAEYLVKGQFQVSVLRLPENKIRLKLVGLRNKNKSASVGVGYDGVLEIFKVSRLDRQITRSLDLNPLKLTFNDGKNNLFMVDYVLDLNNEEVKKAYSDVIRQMTQMESAKLMNPTGTRDDLRAKLLMDIMPIDQIVQNDRMKAEKRADRSFKGSLEQDYRSTRLNLGLKIIRLVENRDYAQNRLVSVNLDEGASFHLINSYQARTEANFLFAWARMRRDVRFNAIHTTDENFQNSEADDLVLSIETKDRKFSNREMAKLKQTLSRTLTPDLYDLVNLGKWGAINDWDANTAIRYQIVLHPEAIAAAPELSEKQIQALYLAYLKEIDSTDLLLTYTPKRTSLVGLDDNATYVAAFARPIEFIAKQLGKALNRDLSSSERSDALMELRKSRLFKQTGIRFLLSLLPKEKLKDLIRFDFDMESTNGKRLQATFGNEAENAVYKRMLYIQSILNNDGLDLRLESETIKMNLMSNKK